MAYPGNVQKELKAAIIIPKPQQIKYPTLLDMPEPTLLCYTLATVIAAKRCAEVAGGIEVDRCGEMVRARFSTLC